MSSTDAATPFFFAISPFSFFTLYFRMPIAPPFASFAAAFRHLAEPPLLIFAFATC